MTLHIIGIGLNNEKDITVKGLELVKKSELVYLEVYTSKLNCTFTELAKFYNKQIILATREMVEGEGVEGEGKGEGNEIIEHAKTKDVAFLVIGEPFSATTHIDLFMMAKKNGIQVTVTHNSSVLTAVGITGLQLYKFGKTTSIPYPEKNFVPETAYDIIKMNLANGLHTLILLDIKYELQGFMTLKQAIEILLQIEEKRKYGVFTKKRLCIGCSRLGSDDAVIKAGTAEELLMHDFGAPMHCLIVPGELHFMEEEALKMWK